MGVFMFLFPWENIRMLNVEFLGFQGRFFNLFVGKIPKGNRQPPWVVNGEICCQPLGLGFGQ